jgi:hypothetical protein
MFIRIHQRLAYVAVSRGQYDARIYTDDKAKRALCSIAMCRSHRRARGRRRTSRATTTVERRRVVNRSVTRGPSVLHEITLRLVALIEQASVVQRILRHLGLPTEVPEPRPARAPPRRLETLEDQSRDAPELDAAW